MKIFQTFMLFFDFIVNLLKVFLLLGFRHVGNNGLSICNTDKHCLCYMNLEMIFVFDGTPSLRKKHMFCSNYVQFF